MDFDKILDAAEERTLLLELGVSSWMLDSGDIDWDFFGSALVEPQVGSFGRGK